MSQHVKAALCWSGGYKHLPMKKKTASAFLLESLEPRLLFSADSLVPLAAGGVLSADSQPTLQASLPPVISIEQIQLQADQVREIIFIDAGVDDLQLLIDDLKSSGKDEQQYAFFILDSDRDGISQISETLQRYQGITPSITTKPSSTGEKDSVPLPGSYFSFTSS